MSSGARTSVDIEFSGEDCLCDLQIKIEHVGIHPMEHVRYLHRVCAEELAKDCDYEQLANRIRDRVCKETNANPDELYVTINPDKKQRK